MFVLLGQFSKKSSNFYSNILSHWIMTKFGLYGANSSPFITGLHNLYLPSHKAHTHSPLLWPSEVSWRNLNSNVVKSASYMFFSPAGPSGPTPRPSAFVLRSNASRSSTVEAAIRPAMDVKNPASRLSFNVLNICCRSKVLEMVELVVCKH